MVFVQKHLKIFVSKFWKFFEEFLYTFQKIKTPVFSLVHSKKVQIVHITNCDFRAHILEIFRAKVIKIKF